MTSTGGSEDCDTDCNIECILAEERDPYGNTFYLVRWELLPLSRATWEAKSKFTEHTDLLDQWEADKKAASLPGGKPLFNIDDYYMAVEASEDERCEKKKKESLMTSTARRREGTRHGDPVSQIGDNTDDHGQEVALTKRNQPPLSPDEGRLSLGYGRIAVGNTRKLQNSTVRAQPSKHMIKDSLSVPASKPGDGARTEQEQRTDPTHSVSLTQPAVNLTISMGAMTAHSSASPMGTPHNDTYESKLTIPAPHHVAPNTATIGFRHRASMRADTLQRKLPHSPLSVWDCPSSATNATLTSRGPFEGWVFQRQSTQQQETSAPPSPMAPSTASQPNRQSPSSLPNPGFRDTLFHAPPLLDRLDHLIRNVPTEHQVDHGRLVLLREAIQVGDWFYVALSQLHTLSSTLTDLPIVERNARGFSCLDTILCPNTQLTGQVWQALAVFPWPIVDIYSSANKDQYHSYMMGVVQFLYNLATHWDNLVTTCERRETPPLVEDLWDYLRLPSSVLQTTVFRALGRMIALRSIRPVATDPDGYVAQVEPLHHINQYFFLRCGLRRDESSMAIAHRALRGALHAWKDHKMCVEHFRAEQSNGQRKEQIHLPSFIMPARITDLFRTIPSHTTGANVMRAPVPNASEIADESRPYSLGQMNESHHEGPVHHGNCQPYPTVNAFSRDPRYNFLQPTLSPLPTLASSFLNQFGNPPALRNSDFSRLDTVGSHVITRTPVFQPKAKLVRPPHTYADLIHMAISQATNRRLRFRSICAWMSDHFEFYKTSPDNNWQKGVSNALSSSEKFIRFRTSANDRHSRREGDFWGLKNDESTLAAPAGEEEATVAAVPALGREMTAAIAPPEEGNQTTALLSIAEMDIATSPETEAVQRKIETIAPAPSEEVEHTAQAVSSDEEMKTFVAAAEEVADTRSRPTEPKHTDRSRMSPSPEQMPASSPETTNKTSQSPWRIPPMPREPEPKPLISAEGLTRPQYTYAELISLALTQAPEQHLPVQRIFEWITDNFPFYAYSTSDWRRKIRTKLVKSKIFSKEGQHLAGSGGVFWKIKQREATSDMLPPTVMTDHRLDRGGATPLLNAEQQRQPRAHHTSTSPTSSCSGSSQVVEHFCGMPKSAYHMPVPANPSKDAEDHPGAETHFVKRHRSKTNDGKRPPHSYSKLISMAITQSPEGHLTRRQICCWISENFAFFRNCDESVGSWRRAVQKVLRNEKQTFRTIADLAGGLHWALVPDSFSRGKKRHNMDHTTSLDGDINNEDRVKKRQRTLKIADRS